MDWTTDKKIIEPTSITPPYYDLPKLKSEPNQVR